MNNAINEIKNTLEGTNSRITEGEDKISEVEDRMVEINEAERKKEKKKNYKKRGEAGLRWQRNRMGRPPSPPQILQKNILMLRKFHKTTSEC